MATSAGTPGAWCKTGTVRRYPGNPGDAHPIVLPDQAPGGPFDPAYRPNPSRSSGRSKRCDGRTQGGCRLGNVARGAASSRNGSTRPRSGLCRESGRSVSPVIVTRGRGTRTCVPRRASFRRPAAPRDTPGCVAVWLRPRSASDDGRAGARSGCCHGWGQVDKRCGVDRKLNER